MRIAAVLSECLQQFKTRLPSRQTKRLTTEDLECLNMEFSDMLQMEEHSQQQQTPEQRSKGAVDEPETEPRGLDQVSNRDQTKQYDSELDGTGSSQTQQRQSCFRVLPVLEQGVCFSSLVLQHGHDYIFTVPRALEDIIDKEVPLDVIAAAAHGLDLLDLHRNSLHAATVSDDMYKLLTVLGDEIVSQSIAGGYMVRSLAATYSPAALACYLAVVLDPGRRVFKQSAGGCFEYVQEARAAPPTSESNLQIQEVTSGASCMVGPGNLGRKRPQPDADSSSSSTGHNAGEPCLDCSRLTCFRQYPGVAITGIFQSSDLYWVSKAAYGLKIQPADFKAKVVDQIAVSLTEGANPPDQRWRAAGAALAIVFRRSGHADAHIKLLHHPKVVDFPGYDGYANAAQRCLHDVAALTNGGTIQKLASLLGDKARLTTDITGRLLRLNQQAGVNQLPAGRQPPQLRKPSAASVISMASDSSATPADIAITVTPTRACLTAVSSTQTDKQVQFEHVCFELAAAAAAAVTSGSSDEMEDAVRDARARLEQQQQYEREMLPCGSGGLWLAVQQQLLRMRDDNQDDRLANAALLQVVVDEVEVLYGL